MKKFISILLLVPISFSWNAFVCAESQDKNDYKVSFKLERDCNQLVVKPMCLNNTKSEVVLRYKLEFRRISQNKNDFKPVTQSGIIELSPGEEKLVCRMEVPSREKDGYEINLYLYKSGIHVGVYSISRRPWM